MKKIIHIDMDCFFAAVAIREQPALADKPVAIGGAANRRGVLATCNYVARQFGIGSAMSTSEALRRCPDLVVLPSNMSLYRQVSAQLHQIFARYTDKIEPVSLDEAYLDVTHCTQHHGSATLIAQSIRAAIESELSLTASAGIAPCKFLAKIASDENKPNGQCVITPDRVEDFVRQLPLEKIPGVGKKTAARLASLDLYHCRDVQRLSLDDMASRFGRQGALIWYRSHGVDDRDVETHREAKSVSVETTLDQDILSFDDCLIHLNQLQQDLYSRFSRHAEGKQIRNIKIKLKFSDFQQTTVEYACQQWLPELYLPLLQRALLKQNGRKIRLIGLGVGLETEYQQQQLSLLL